ncbi:hypothetical protein GCK72_025463 [Caenorhabditis remanei]|uniref:JmjC domain-containing protein n=1 Tax=Caenorhabditis remanei TaxID=31234 RepID=A0A6A5G230_CAERE|nr:hypothetical protein GCK72_025463 [Caenorhabditis remanei]KAF1748996.1 hypothetical protein GCK72_025463 [Caenorhabditis remanei]
MIDPDQTLEDSVTSGLNIPNGTPTNQNRGDSVIPGSNLPDGPPMNQNRGDSTMSHENEIDYEMMDIGQTNGEDVVDHHMDDDHMDDIDNDHFPEDNQSASNNHEPPVEEAKKKTTRKRVSGNDSATPNKKRNTGGRAKKPKGSESDDAAEGETQNEKNETPVIKTQSGRTVTKPQLLTIKNDEKRRSAKKPNAAAPESEKDDVETAQTCKKAAPTSVSAEKVKQTELIAQNNKMCAHNHMQQYLNKCSKDSPGYKRAEQILKKYKERPLPFCEIPISAVHPDRQNYRNAGDFLLKLVAPVPSDFSKASNLKGNAQKCPELLQTGKLFVDCWKDSAWKIIKLAQQYKNTGQNKVYESQNKVMFPEPSILGEANEDDFFKFHGYSKPTTGDEHEKKRLPVTVIKSTKDIQDDDYAAFFSHCSIAVVEDFGAARGIDDEKFSLESLSKLIDGQTQVEALMTIPEKSDSNTRSLYNVGEGVAKDSGWEIQNIRRTFSLEKLTKYYKDCERISLEACERLVEKPYDHEEIIEELIKNHLEAQIPPPEQFPSGAIVSSFLTNLDLPDEVLEILKPELDKFPDCFNPSSINNMLKHVEGTLNGIKTPQIYGKIYGSKTPGHCENGGVASINYNAGKASAIWYAMNFEFIGEFLKFMEDKGHDFYNSAVMPDEVELAKRGIIVTKFEQKPGSLVYVGPGTYHYVHTAGITVNVSWNLIPKTFTQMAVMALFHDHNALKNYESVIPLEPMLWNMLEQNEKFDKLTLRVFLAMLCRSLSHCTMEIGAAENRGMNIAFLGAEKYKDSFLGTLRCSKKDCRKRALFNLITVDKSRNIHCVNCAKATDKVYAKFTLTQLAARYEKFKEDNGLNHPLE